MANQDTLVELMRQFYQVVDAGYKPIPDYVHFPMPEGSLAFWTRRIVPPDPPPGTWPGRDDHAEIYVPPEVFGDPQNNEAVLAQMTHVLAEIRHDVIPVPDQPSDIIPENPPPEVEETQFLGDGQSVPNP